MRFGVTFTPPEYEKVGELASLAEESGFEWLGMGDSQSLYRELYVSLTVAALRTSHIYLGPMVTNLVTRNLAVTASSLATLQEVAAGRVRVGIGTGDSALLNLGEKPMKVSEFQAALEALMRLVSGETVQVFGREMHVEWASGGLPLYVSAEGPRMFDLAGRYADGVIVGSGVTSDAIDWALSLIEQGAKATGRELSDVDVWFFAKGNLAYDGESAVEELRGTLAASANHAFRFTSDGVSRSPLPDSLSEPVKQLQTEYDPRHHAKVERSPNAELVGRLGLTEYLARRFAVAGDEDGVRSRVAELERDGVEKLILTGINRNPPAFVRGWGEIFGSS